MEDVTLKNYCLVVDNTMDKDLCDRIINFYEKNDDIQQRYNNNGYPNFSQVNFTQNSSRDLLLHNDVVNHIIAAVKIYQKYVPETIFWRPGFEFEQLRIKKYLNDGNDMFDTHIDAASSDTMKRFFAFFWYLNDVEQGGETEFLNIDMKVSPKAGRLVMFPPMWLFPHRGLPPVSNNKYLLSTYLHFA